MVEPLILVAIIIGIRSLYLWATKGKEEAKEFADKSTNQVNQAMGWLAKVFLILLGLFVLLLLALAS